MKLTPIIWASDFQPIETINIPSLSPPAGNKGHKGRRPVYKDILCAFDIETTRLPDIEQSIMYVWQFQLGDRLTIMGRTWEEYKDFIDRLTCTCGEYDRFMVYVHNLSYEFQWLSAVFDFKTKDVFCMDSRKILKAVTGHIEYRCSYLNTNMGLAAFTNSYQVEHTKRSGDDFDYSITRYPWTELTDQELEYCQYDVVGLVEAMQNRMDLEHDDLNSIPLTSTGYVRRRAKATMRALSRSYVTDQLPDYHTYTLLRSAFRGGNTHASRYYAGQILHNVTSADRSSSYPDVLVNCKYPVSVFYPSGPLTMEELAHLIYDKGKAVIMRIRLRDIKLRVPTWPCPYLPVDKCEELLDAVVDNGRVLQASLATLCCTDIDFKILLDEYDFEVEILDSAYARYGKLPTSLVNLVIDFYKSKTELKNVEGRALEYDLAKALLNSCYGMMVQDPCKQTMQYHPDATISDELYKEQTALPEDLLTKYNRKAFLAYQWGVWCTSWARLRLEEMIRISEEQGSFVYTDTDSCKYLGNVDWSEYNRLRIQDSKKSGAYATDPKGVVHYMGVAEDDGFYEEFATLGAKKYVTRAQGCKLKCTIAGVNKKLGGLELEEHGGISAFKEGFIFEKAGGNELIYNDFPPMDSIEVDGHVLPIIRNVVIRPSTYQLGITGDYKRLLETVRYFDT